MPINERDRIRFHGWLLQHDLDEEVADAILATMPPYDWHELATKDDLGSRFAVVDTRFDGLESQIERRFQESDRRFDQSDQKMAAMALEIRAIMFTLIGLIVSVLLAGSAALFG